MKKIIIILLVTHCFLMVVLSFGAYPGNIIVSNAEGYVNTPITTPLPSPYIGVFDCSGVVSISAGLRRHYTVSEMRTYFTLPRLLGWGEELQPGDLIMRTKHVMIFVSRYIEEGTHRVSVIEASDSAGKVIKRPGWYYDKDGVYRYFSAYKDPYYHSDSDIADCFPYYFIDDHTPPNINVSGVVNGGIYNKKPVILSYSITDDVDIYPYVKILLTRDGVKVIDKEYNKYETQKAKPIEETKELTQDGKYELKITAEDWENWGTKGNNVLLHFIIDATPPKIGLKQPPDIIWEHHQNGWVEIINRR